MRPTVVSLFEKLNAVAAKFLYVSLDHVGSIPNGSHFETGHAFSVPSGVSLRIPMRPSARAISQVSSDGLEGTSAELKECKGSLQFFWEQLVRLA